MSCEKVGYLLRQNMQQVGFVWSLISSAALHTVRGEWAESWGALKRTDVDTPVMSQKQSKRKSAINVNAFCVISTSLIRSCLLLSTKSIHRLTPWTCLQSTRALKGFLCLWYVSFRAVYFSFLGLLVSEENRGCARWIFLSVTFYWTCPVF